MKLYSRIYPEVSAHYGIQQHGEKAWSLEFNGHQLIFDSPINDALRNWKDAVRFAQGGGPHWTAVLDTSLGDKTVTPPPHVMRNHRPDPKSETTPETRRALWELPCVNYAGIFDWGTETEVLQVDFCPERHAQANVSLWQTFDGWRYDYHVCCYRTVKGDGKRDEKRYHNTCYAASIDQWPYPSRTAALECFWEMARHFLLEAQPQEPDPNIRSAISSSLDRAKSGIESGEGWKHYNPETREEIPNPRITDQQPSELNDRQILVCGFCGWRGPSPVKKKLRYPGKDHPIQCRQCHAIGLAPLKTKNP